MRSFGSEDGALIKKNNNNKNDCPRNKVILLLFVCCLFTAALTNIDRLYQIFQGKNPQTSTNGDESLTLTDGYDVLIVGGGPSGVSNMHFLSMHDPSQKILLIEKLGRFGGRTQSWKLTYNDSYKIQFEGGAMRFAPTNWYINKMLHKVGLCSDTWERMDSLGSFGGYYYYRNTRVDRRSANTAYYTSLYNFADNDLTSGGSIRSLSSLNSPARTEIWNENNGGQSPQNNEQWEAFRNGTWTLRGVPIRQWNRKAFADRFGEFSEEWWAHYRDTGTGADWYRDVAGGLYQGPTMFPNYVGGSITGLSSALHTIKGGYNMLVWKLVENVTQHSENNELQLYSELVSIDESDDEYNYTVGIRNVTTDEIRYVKANKVILSLDQQSLKRVLPALRPINTQPVRDMVNSVASGYCFKANFVYNSEEMLDIREFVNSRTQLTMRYYMLDDSWTNNTLTAIHFYSCGAERSKTAHALQTLNKPMEYDTNLIKLDPNSERNILVMSEFLMDQIHNEMELMLNFSIPKPIFASYHPLGMNESNGDGLSTWAYNSDRQFILSNDGITKPKKDEDIYISVVDYSNSQGWAYGSIWAAIKTVTQYFGVPDPLKDEPQCN